MAAITLLEDKVVIITGSSSGIGRGIAVACARQGAKLVLHHQGLEHTQLDAEALQEELSTRFGAVAILIGADVTAENVTQLIIDEAIRAFGTVDVFVNNAGICVPTPAEFVTRDLMQKHLDTNLKAAYFLTQAAVHEMKKQGQGGSIVFVSSNTAVVGVQNLTHYSASKAALLGMATTFAVEYGKHQIRFNCVLPGPTETGMAQPFIQNLQDRANLERRVPLGRIGVPEDIGGAVVFFASDLSAFITGQHILVDGGSSCFYL